MSGSPHHVTSSLKPHNTHCPSCLHTQVNACLDHQALQDGASCSALLSSSPSEVTEAQLPPSGALNLSQSINKCPHHRCSGHSHHLSSAPGHQPHPVSSVGLRQGWFLPARLGNFHLSLFLRELPLTFLSRWGDCYYSSWYLVLFFLSLSI